MKTEYAQPARMRTRDNAIKMIREIDPETALTRTGLDSLIRSAKLPTTKIGNKILVNVDLLLEMMAMGFEVEQEPDNVTGIRRIDY